MPLPWLVFNKIEEIAEPVPSRARNLFSDNAEHGSWIFWMASSEFASARPRNRLRLLAMTFRALEFYKVFLGHDTSVL
jgi:hypothetical protein